MNFDMGHNGGHYLSLKKEEGSLVMINIHHMIGLPDKISPLTLLNFDRVKIRSLN